MARNNLITEALLGLSALLIAGCGGSSLNPVNPPSVHAGTTSLIFSGRYLFRAELHTVNSATPFVEAGFLDADGKGAFTLSATYNDGSTLPLTSPNVNASGSYTVDAEGFGTITANSSTDAFRATEHFFCVLSGDYCPVVSSEAGRAWQGKLWRDNSSNTTLSFAGSYIFESDGALNQFAESGVITADVNGGYTLASIYNVALHPEQSNLGSPTPAFTCGKYSFNVDIIGHASQGQCPSTAGFDTFAIYCLRDGSVCPWFQTRRKRAAG
jgi:hypothetical protein